MLVIAVMIAGDVEHAAQFAVRVMNRHAGTRQEAVRREIVLMQCTTVGRRSAMAVPIALVPWRASDQLAPGRTSALRLLITLITDRLARQTREE